MYTDRYQKTQIERAAHLYECYDVTVAHRICDEEGISIEASARGLLLAEARREERAINRMVHGSPEYGSARREQEHCETAGVLTDGQSPSCLADRKPSSAGVARPSVNTSGRN
jgi:hypothetical protein